MPSGVFRTGVPTDGLCLWGGSKRHLSLKRIGHVNSGTALNEHRTGLSAVLGEGKGKTCNKKGTRCKRPYPFETFPVQVLLDAASP